MDIVIASALQKSCLSSINKSSDIVLKAAEKIQIQEGLELGETHFFFFYDAFCSLGS